MSKRRRLPWDDRDSARGSRELSPSRSWDIFDCWLSGGVRARVFLRWMGIFLPAAVPFWELLGAIGQVAEEVWICLP